MGKLATVVYDAVRHVPLVVRTRVATPAERYGVIDAVAAFAHHCETLRGVVHSPVHVSALWGGPPFLTYQVAQSRFRVIIMWMDAPGDFDIAHDVQDALIRLHGAVSSVASKLVKGDVASISHVYTIAGNVLQDEHVESSQAPHEHFLPAKKPSALMITRPVVDETTKPGFLRNIFGGGKGKRAARLDSDASSNILSIASASNQDSQSASLPLDFEMAESNLNLPDQLFTWSDFGAPLPRSAGDLEWIAHLIQGMEKQKAKPRPPLIRASGSDSGSRDTGRVSAGSQSTLGISAPPGPSLFDSSSAPSSGSRQLPMSPAQNPPARDPNENGARTPSASVQSSAEAAPSSVQSSTALLSPGPVVGNAGVGGAAGPSTSSSAGMSGNFQTMAPSNVDRTPPARPSAELPPRPSNSARQEAQARHVESASISGDTNFDVSMLSGLQNSRARGTASVPSAADATAPNGPVRMKMNEFANSMQAGNYPLALQQVNSTLEMLAVIRPTPEKETSACATYYQALKILIRVRVLEDELTRAIPGSPDALRRIVELALITMFLAEHRSLLPRHSAAAKQMAVEKNIVAGNFGMAARWLRSLIEAASPPQKNVFARRLQLCVQNGELNAHMPPTKWLCYNTLTVVRQNPLKCGLCPAVYAPQTSGVTPNQRCPVCRVGTIATFNR
jgi:hypothetical protein